MAWSLTSGNGGFVASTEKSFLGDWVQGSSVLGGVQSLGNRSAHYSMLLSSTLCRGKEFRRILLGLGGVLLPQCLRV